MEELPPVPESPPEAPQSPPMCLGARLLNVFAIPGEVFAGVRASRLSVGNWLVPALLLMLVGVFAAILVASQPALQKQLNQRIEQQAKALAQQVEAGKLKRADADRALALARAITQPPVLKVLGGMAAGVFGIARVFWWALILWFLGRAFLKVHLDYLKTLEVAGLALMISVLGAVVTLLLTINLSKAFATPSLALVVSEFDLRRMSRLLLGAAYVFSFWFVGVLGVGLAKLAGVPFLRAVWLVFATWVIQESFLAMVGGALGQFGW